MYRVWIFLFFASLQAFELFPLSPRYEVKVLKVKELHYRVDGKKFCEISDVVYDKNTSKLFFISDKGVLFSFFAVFSKDSFLLEPLHAYSLKDKNGKILPRNQRDSEGMALDEKGNLYISFERITKIFQFSKKGVRLKEIPLPKQLQNVEVSSSNKSLESLAFHPKYGLITALEYPKRGTKRIYQTIYSTSNSFWHFLMEPISRNGIAEIEVMDDGSFLILERAFNWFIGDFEVNLVRIDPTKCLNTFCQKELVAKLKINKFFGMENFEGLTRVGKGRYLLISDDNNNILAKTTLVYFEITPKK